MSISIRPIQPTDCDNLKLVLDSCELFPSELLDEMIYDYFNNPETEDIWFTAISEEIPVAVGHCDNEKLTEGTYNLLAIGVSKNVQGKGIAKEMMHYIEQLLKDKGARILIVETSSDEAQFPARSLYNKIGYNQEAIIRDFWNDGEDKIVFWKRVK